ncbi:MAG: Abi-alpha family protein [Halieaceae bacterium]|nr:Abi-alpha family protein [Halieaceae bacterium]
MTIESDTVTETSRAVKETAVATGKVVDLADRFGTFVAKFVAGPLEQSVGIFEDQLRFARFKRQLRLMEKVNELMADVCGNKQIKPLELKLAIPLFQAASLEDDDDLQDIWARLLVNSSVASHGIELRRAYIDILVQLTQMDANILDKIYAIPHDTHQNLHVLTGGLPDTVSVRDVGSSEQNGLVQPSPEVTISLANLSRLGCIGLPTAWDGGEIFTSVYHTVMGRSLIHACRLDN